MLVAPEHIDTYVRMHADTWPELVRDLDRCGWQNYSLFLRDDGFLAGYLETPDWAAAQQAMSASTIAPLWSIEMDRLVVPGTRMRYLMHRLTLEAALGLPPTRAPHRHCVVLESPPPLTTSDLTSLHQRGMRNVSVFEREDGLAVIYGETEYAGDPPWPWTDRVSALNEVFNLAEQLAR